MTVRALNALEEAGVIVGYHTYIDLIGGLIGSREVVATGMTRELDRCRQAVRLALAGKRVAVVSSGDPGVYGMAGLILEVLHQDAPDSNLPVEIIPGVTAATAAAAYLGAPLMHDFAVISLSDRLTPWELIARRLELAAQGDFVTVLYNPRSRGRQEHLGLARDIFLRHRAPETPVGVVRNSGRDGEESWISSLDKFTGLPVDMLATVIIGNSRTRVLGGRMVTPRGYKT